MSAHATDIKLFHSYLNHESVNSTPITSANTSRRTSTSDFSPVSQSQAKKEKKTLKKATISESRAVYFSMLQR
ncbi:hypothetical protein D8B26_005775 [Coccidioides posadasii str. Silveira]|uniref:Uncharacterized protein n=1 Tax=Coccidioides posadasii (strain RMSCC 757 / Silveira) TaxID=443226 RepID=E9DAW1_COCPS|nr:hypothetical protein CPSG_06963 [Coccidioides posadasii str. Silveira]QVM11124.1 hypothetical protein D8B26_005775 [Coccidioides posadasii str. Silveira]